MARQSPQRSLSRLSELRRTVGDPRAAWIAPLWAVAKRYVVIARDLTDVSDLPVASSAYSCAGLESTSPAELIRFDRRLTTEEIERRLRERQICQVWRRDGHVVHFRWLASAPTVLPFLGLDFEPAKGDCLLFEVFTLIDRRQSRVHTDVARHALRRASDTGHRRMLALCAWWNGPARRVGEKYGFQIAGTVTRWQLGPAVRFSFGGRVALRQRTLSVLL